MPARIRLYLLPHFGEIRAAEFGTFAVIKRGFHLAAQSDPPQVMRVPHIPMLEENNVRKGFLEHDAYVRLRDALPPQIRLLFVLAYHVGCCKGELTSIRWSQIDLQAKRIRLEPGTTKNKEGRSLPIYGEMLPWLQFEKEVRDATCPDSEAVFSRSGKPIRSFRKSWAAACERAGLAGLLFHDLQRTAVRNMVRAGIPEKIAMQISGHKTRSVFDC